ncbi:transporter substrate-binding domain-containing protein [Desulfobacterales bacterium HSG16]|nr:transporter substrate-binding domain-containing protein [Desulfobacterales bacterium HSG16]
MKQFGFKYLAMIIYSLLFFICSTGSGGAEPLKVGILDFPPFAIVKGMDEPKGILVDQAARILKKASIDYEMRGYPPKRLYNNIALGHTDLMIGIKGVPAYEGKVLYSSMPLNQIDLRVYTIGDKKLPTSIKELAGKTFISLRGYGYGGLVQFLDDPASKITLDPSKNHKSAFLKLKAERADYLLDYNRPVLEMLKNNPIENLKSSSIFKIYLYFAISHKTAGGQKIMDQLEKAFLQLKKDGQIVE